MIVAGLQERPLFFSQHEKKFDECRSVELDPTPLATTHAEHCPH
jgi:hypothetical protein